MRVYLDANIFAFAAFDSGKQGEKCRQIITRVSSGELKAFTSSLALDELLLVMIKNGKTELMDNVIEAVYAIPNCFILPTSATAPRVALEYIKKYGLKLRDALHCAVMHENELKTIFSDDKDFDKVKEFERIF